eukprot:UN21505
MLTRHILDLNVHLTNLGCCLTLALIPFFITKQHIKHHRRKTNTK